MCRVQTDPPWIMVRGPLHWQRTQWGLCVERLTTGCDPHRSDQRACAIEMITVFLPCDPSLFSVQCFASVLHVCRLVITGGQPEDHAGRQIAMLREER